jgi:hypothetical protein
MARNCNNEDFVIPGPQLPNGNSICIRHSADHSLTLGEVHPVKEGEPLHDDAVLLKHRENSGVYDIIGSVGDMKAGKPSMVNSQQYKDRWESIFGGRTAGQA